MNLKNRLKLMRNTLETELPQLLAAAGLDNFDEYLDTEPTDAEQRICSVQSVRTDREPGNYTWTAGFIFQLFEESQPADYQDVIDKSLLELLPPRLFGFTSYESFSTLLQGLEGTSSTFIFAQITYVQIFDDCED